MQHLKELGAQVAALWSDPSPRDSPREPDAAQVRCFVHVDSHS